MGDNRETVAQAMYGKSEDDLEIEQRELKRLMKGEAEPEAEAAKEHDEAVRSDEGPAPDYAATHQQSTHSATHEAPLNQQLSAAGAQDAEASRAAYPTESDQKVTTAAVSDKKLG